jgi:hypothetical protein
MQRYVDLQAFSLYRQNDKVEQFLALMREHDRGNFRRSADLVDEILTDDRISGVAETRQAAIKAAPFTVEPSGDRRIERRLAEVIGGKDKQSGRWSRIVTTETLGELLQWGWFLNFGLAQILWLREPRAWWPYLELWHPRWVRWEPSRRAYVVQTENKSEVVLPRLDQQPRGDGQWFQWMPNGVQGWTRALIRSLAFKYLSRQWNERDWDRYNETRSQGILKGTVPLNAEAIHKREFFQQLSNLGSDPVVVTPQQTNPDGSKGAGFDIAAVEFTAQSWETLDRRKAVLDVDIAVRVLGQNLTTEVKEGSRAASQTHELIRIDKAIADSLIGPALRMQVLTWWAEFNYGDPELAPKPCFNVQPPEDEVGEATAIKTLGEGLSALKAAESRLDVSAIVEEHGYPLLSEEEMLARQEDAAARAAEALAAAGSGAETDESDEGAKSEEEPGADDATTGSGAP